MNNLTPEREAEIREYVRSMQAIADEGAPDYALSYEDVDALTLQQALDLLHELDRLRAELAAAQEQVRCWRAVKALRDLGHIVLIDQGVTIDNIFAQLGEPEIILAAAESILGADWDKEGA